MKEFQIWIFFEKRKVFNVFEFRKFRKKVETFLNILIFKFQFQKKFESFDIIKISISYNSKLHYKFCGNFKLLICQQIELFLEKDNILKKVQWTLRFV